MAHPTESLQVDENRARSPCAPCAARPDGIQEAGPPLMRRSCGEAGAMRSSCDRSASLRKNARSAIRWFADVAAAAFSVRIEVGRPARRLSLTVRRHGSNGRDRIIQTLQASQAVGAADVLCLRGHALRHHGHQRRRCAGLVCRLNPCSQGGFVFQGQAGETGVSGVEVQRVGHMGGACPKRPWPGVFRSVAAMLGTQGMPPISACCGLTPWIVPVKPIIAKLPCV